MTASFPAFKQKKLQQSIQDSLIRYIVDAQLSAGDKLPSQNEMVAQMNVSRTSIREAISQLEAKGILKQIQGLGTFLNADPNQYHTKVKMDTSITEMIIGMGKQPGTSSRTVEIRPILPEFEGAFGKNVDECVCLERTRTANDKPFAVSIAYFAPTLVKTSDEIVDRMKCESLFDFLAEFYNDRPNYFENQIEIEFPQDSIAGKLGISKNKPIFKLARRYFGQSGKLLVVSNDFFNLKSLSFTVTKQNLSSLIN